MRDAQSQSRIDLLALQAQKKAAEPIGDIDRTAEAV
jgi:hypothetical protein